VSEPGGPRQRGRHSSSDDGSAGVPDPHWAPRREFGPATPYGIPSQAGGHPTDGFRVPAYLPSPAGRGTGGFRPVSGVLDRFGERTGPVAEPEWWSYGSTDHPSHPLSARHRGIDDPGPGAWDTDPGRQQPGNTPREQYHPSAPLPPLPSGVWDRLRPRDSEVSLGRGDGAYDDRAHDGPAHDDEAFDDDAATVAHPRLGRPTEQARSDVGSYTADPPLPVEDDRTDAHRFDQDVWDDRTGGLEVIGAHVGDDGSRGRRWRRGRGQDRRDAVADPALDADLDGHPGADLSAGDHALAGGHDAPVPVARYDQYADDHGYDGYAQDPDGVDDLAFDDDGDHDQADQHHGYDEPGYDDHLPDEDIPVAPYDARSGRRRRRRRIAVLLSLLVLAGLVAGIVVGGGKLLTMINPASRDFTGQGTGTAEVRINQGDTLSDIGQVLVDGGVIASVGPFVDAAEAEPDATGIQPGVYRLREQMSGKAAVDLLLDPASRLVTRITLREGLTVKATLAKLAETTGTPVAQFEAAADPAALGLPDYARGKLEGFLFPATYDFEPDTTPADMLKQMVDRAVHALDELQIAPADRLTVLTKASLVQAEASSTEDMAKVARVLENRLADGMALQLDTTVNYANGKSGITTTLADRKNPSPYNTYVHPGLPPGAIDNPGEEALRAALSPAVGEWRFFVVVNPDTGETRFAVTGAEHQQNVLLFQQWLREHPGG
jgi:uncharacterized YceG family protein